MSMTTERANLINACHYDPLGYHAVADMAEEEGELPEVVAYYRHLATWMPELLMLSANAAHAHAEVYNAYRITFDSVHLTSHRTPKQIRIEVARQTQDGLTSLHIPQTFILLPKHFCKLPTPTEKPDYTTIDTKSWRYIRRRLFDIMFCLAATHGKTLSKGY